MDPVTGLSPRAFRLLGLLVVAGIAAGTVAALGGQDAGCPEERYGCATSHEGEPAVLGVLVTSDLEAAVEEVRGGVGETFLDRSLQVSVEVVACDPVEGTEAARQLATDPLDDAPAFAVIAAACPRVLLPAAQILGDSAVPLITVTPAGSVPRNARSLLDGSAVAAEDGTAALGSLVVEAAEGLGLEHEGDLLVPRIPLIRTLEAQGLPRP